jgi:Domain of unknown function (DUF4124)
MKIHAQGRNSFFPHNDGIHPLVVCLLVPLITYAAMTPLSAEVYKWVDEKGKTHYSDKPHDEKAETVQIKKTPELDPTHKSRAEKQRRLLKVLDEERQETKQRKAAATAEKHKREANCAKAKKELQNMKNASFLYKESNDPKNPLIYSDKERAHFTEEAKKAVQHWCK